MEPQENEELSEELNDEANEETLEENPIEQRALKMGWVPEDQFKGDPNNWRPADEFVERGEKMIPILRANIRRMEKSQAERDKAFTDHLNLLRNNLRAQKLAEHEKQKRQAVDDGDTETYNRLSIDPPKDDIPEFNPPTPKTDAVFDEWREENHWYQDDYEKHQEAENYGQFLRSSQPHLEGRDFLDEVSKHVRKKFSNPNRNKPSAVDGGTQKASNRSGTLYNKLEAEAKAVFNNFVQQGIFKNTADDREAYAKDVLGE